MNQVNANNSTRRARSAKNRSNKRQRARYRYSQEHTGSTGNTYWRTPFALAHPKDPHPKDPHPMFFTGIGKHRRTTVLLEIWVLMQVCFLYCFILVLAPDSSSAVAWLSFISISLFRWQCCRAFKLPLCTFPAKGCKCFVCVKTKFVCAKSQRISKLILFPILQGLTIKY